MTTYYSDFYGSPANANTPAPKASPGGRSVAQVCRGVYEIASALSKDDIVKLFKLPAGAVPLMFDLVTQAVDTDGTPTLELDVGTSDDPDNLLDSGVVQDAAVTNHVNMTTGAVHHGVGAGIGTKLTADTEYQMKVVAAATAGGTGTVSAVCIWMAE